MAIGLSPRTVYKINREHFVHNLLIYGCIFYYRNGENDSVPPNKRKKKEMQADDLQEVPSSLSANGNAMKGASLTYMNDQLRRSNRRQKVRGEKEYIVDSTMLLRDLKVKVITK